MSDAVSRRYAQALFALADEASAIDKVGEDLERFVASADQVERQLAVALESPVFTVGERRAVLDKVLPKLKLHPLTLNLLRLANDKRRMAIVPAIVEAYRKIADDSAGRVRVTVQTAEPMTSQLEGEVRSALEATTGKSVILKTEVHPELIGGMVARVGDTVYDSSIRTRLEQLRQNLLNTPLAGPIAQA